MQQHFFDAFKGDMPCETYKNKNMRNALHHNNCTLYKCLLIFSYFIPHLFLKDTRPILTIAKGDFDQKSQIVFLLQITIFKKVITNLIYNQDTKKCIFKNHINFW